MPLIVNAASQVPPRWVGRQSTRSVVPVASRENHPECLNVAFINNMPDGALEDTEMQFFQLLESAATDITVRMSLYALFGIPRGFRAQQHLAEYYSGIENLLNSPIDGLIMTGTEPHESSLRDETYWPSLVSVLEWAEQNTISTILSCLAAHASVLHSDGIGRRRLEDKQFGVFDFLKLADHPLTKGTGNLVRFPHSRWNALDANDLNASGYTVLTRSAEAGVDTFVKRKKNSLFVHFQGHPEYSSDTLFKEYRRDIRRFLRHERETYPTVPKGYFGGEAAMLLTNFQGTAMSNRCEDVMSGFPGEALSQSLQNGWSSSATSIYAGWLLYLQEKKIEAATFPAMVALGARSQLRRAAAPRIR